MTFAFLVHPRVALRSDMARVWRPLGLLPTAVYDVALRRLPVPAIGFAEIHLQHEKVGELVLVPFGARHLLQDRRTSVQKVTAAVDRAVLGGADLVGLGGLTAPVTNGGQVLSKRRDIGVTNGNSFTAAIVHRQIRDLLRHAEFGRVGIVGASGSVGSAVTKLLARDAEAAELVLVARGSAALTALAAGLGTRVPVSVAHTIDAVADCDIVVLLTAAADTVLRAEHLRGGAVVLDATQPRNTSADLLQQRPDVTVLDGGVVQVPGMRLRGGSMGLPDGRTFACLAETMLLSLSGHRGHFTLGRPTLDQVDHVTELAERHAHHGFRPAPATSFGTDVQATGTRLAAAPRAAASRAAASHAAVMTV